MLLATLTAAACTSIDDHGAVPNDASNAAATANTKALEETLQRANGSDKVALVPAGKSYYIFNVESSGLRGVTVQIDGSLLASNNMSAWPNSLTDRRSRVAMAAEPQKQRDHDYTYAVLSLYDCHDLTLTGSGVFDGQGYVWWWHVIITTEDHRPHLVAMDQCTNVTIQNLLFRNSPQYHLLLSDMKGLYVSELPVSCMTCVQTCTCCFQILRSVVTSEMSLVTCSTTLIKKIVAIDYSNCYVYVAKEMNGIQHSIHTE